LPALLFSGLNFCNLYILYLDKHDIIVFYQANRFGSVTPTFNNVLILFLAIESLIYFLLAYLVYAGNIKAQK
jgi:hypothetical protein